MEEDKGQLILKLIESVRSRWMLRLSSVGFIMLVNKQTGEYRNIYLKDCKNKRTLIYLTYILDKHPSIED